MSTLESAYQPPTPGPFSIVFIHGLNGHAKTTWMSDPRDTATFWPVWIGEDSGCDTWVLGYDAELSGWRDAAMSLPAQGTSVLDRLDAKAELKGRPLILVGHSMGGLVIKTAIVHATTQGVERYQKLAAQIRGVVFLATPHQGSDLANVADAARITLRTNVQVGDMTAHNDHLLTLNRQFVAQLDKLKFRVRTFVETKGMEVGRRFFGFLLGPRVTVVKAGSGDPHVPGEVPISIAANHSTICKPASRRGEQVHDSLLDFIRECIIAASISEEARRAPPDQSLPIAELLKAPASPAPSGLRGQLSGHTDSRLRPREGVVLGRDKEIAKVLAFLRSSDDSAVVCAQVTGFGGIGKTEVCKAALKAWLEESPAEPVFYIDVPDEASPAELPPLIGRALSADDIAQFDQLVLLLKPGLYYLDNLESVAEKAEGVKLLRALQQRNGVRLLVSSRVDLTGVMSQPIRIDVLPLESAMQLFRKLWAGEVQPPDPDLSRYVSKDLGCHALSITLTARLGHSYSFEDLVIRWHGIGVAFAKGGTADSRLDSLPISLRLTRDALSSQPGTLSLWTLAALFPIGIDAQLVSIFERAGGWPEEARQALSRHHVWQLREDRFHLLPPVARFALDETTTALPDNPWSEVRQLTFNFFVELVSVANSVASTETSRRARTQLLASFDALHRLILHDLRQSAPDAETIKRLLGQLGFLCQFHPVLSAEIFRASVSLYEHEQSELGQANTLQSLGDLESRLGHVDEARSLYDRALALFERQQDELGQANTLQSLGDLDRIAGAFDDALLAYHSALRWYAQQQAPIGEAYTYAEIARCNHALAQKDARDLALKKALVAARTSNTESVMRYVRDVLMEITGSNDAAQAWLKDAGNLG
jgi:predicted alpha/beta hydrolase family esterase